MLKPLILPLIIAIASQANAAVVLSSDFTGVNTSTGTTATNITWTTSDLNISGTSLSFGGSATGFISGGTPANNIQVAGNIETATIKFWTTNFTITPTSNLDLTSFMLAYRAISSGGSNQIGSKDATISIQLFSGIGTGGTSLGTATTDIVDPGGAGSVTANVDLSSFTNIVGGQTYTLELKTALKTNSGGNNWAIDNFALNADTIPEPSSALLLSLGGLLAFRRRR